MDNGGDIALFIRRPIRVGLYAGASPLSGLAFDVAPRPGSIRDLHLVRDRGALVQLRKGGRGRGDRRECGARGRGRDGSRKPGPDDGRSRQLFRFHADGLDGDRGGLVILGDRMAMWGALPPLVRSEIDPDLVTRGRRGP